MRSHERIVLTVGTGLIGIGVAVAVVAIGRVFGLQTRVLWFITRTGFVVFENETVLFGMTAFVAISAFAVETVKGFVAVISLIWTNLTVVSVKSSASIISFSFVAAEIWFESFCNEHCGLGLVRLGMQSIDNFDSGE